MNARIYSERLRMHLDNGEGFRLYVLALGEWSLLHHVLASVGRSRQWVHWSVWAQDIESWLGRGSLPPQQGLETHGQPDTDLYILDFTGIVEEVHKHNLRPLFRRVEWGLLARIWPGRLVMVTPRWMLRFLAHEFPSLWESRALDMTLEGDGSPLPPRVGASDTFPPLSDRTVSVRPLHRWRFLCLAHLESEPPGGPFVEVTAGLRLGNDAAPGAVRQVHAPPARCDHEGCRTAPDVAIPLPPGGSR